MITTGNQHQYVYSDALCYFLYVPEEMATVMEHMDASLVDRTNYYERKLKFLKEHCFFEKREVTLVMVNFILIMTGEKQVTSLLKT